MRQRTLTYSVQERNESGRRRARGGKARTGGQSSTLVVTFAPRTWWYMSAYRLPPSTAPTDGSAIAHRQWRTTGGRAVRSYWCRKGPACSSLGANPLPRSPPFC